MPYKIDLTTDMTTGDAEAGGPWIDVCLTRLHIDFMGKTIDASARLTDSAGVRSNTLSWVIAYVGTDYDDIVATIVETSADFRTAIEKVILDKMLADATFIGTVVAA